MIRNKFLKVAIIWFIMCFLLIALVDSYCKAEPFFTYRATPPEPKVESYELDIDGVVTTVEPTVMQDGSFMLIHDLASMTVGSHVLKSRAYFEKWGWVDWSEEYHMIRPDVLQDPQITTNPMSP